MLFIGGKNELVKAMRDEASYDVIKIWLFAGSCILLAAVLSPFVWQGGLALAEVSSNKETNGILSWLGELFQKATFTQVFQATLGVLVLLGLLPLIDVLRGYPRVGHGQFIVKNQAATSHLLLGFMGSCGLLGALSIGMMTLGHWHWNASLKLTVDFWFWALSAAALSAVIQEGFFRGMAMGVFLRAMSPAAAWGMTAAFFALCHFLVTRPAVCLLEPDGFSMGFTWLGSRIADFADWKIFLREFMPTLLLGGLLGYARWRTASLMLPIGIHAGWLFASSVHARGVIEQASNFPWLGYAALVLTLAMALDFLPVRKPAHAAPKV